MGAPALDPPLRRVRFMTDLPARDCASECGDSSKASPKTLSMASKEERMYYKQDINGPKLFKTAWDVDSEGTDLHRVSAKP